MKTRKSRGKVRPVAGRPEILAAARSIGIRMGWKAVTIRAVAQRLGYTSPLLYEHFRDKQEILTELAIEGQIALAGELLRSLPADPYPAVLTMVERYWSFMLENQQLYRLMNGMDGVLIERDEVTAVAQRNFEAATRIVRAWLVTTHGDGSRAELVFEDLWAILHGMAALHLDRSAPFDVGRAKDCVARLLIGTGEQGRRIISSGGPLPHGRGSGR
jgi:AcrR family transcriptional regulator